MRGEDLWGSETSSRREWCGDRFRQEARPVGMTIRLEAEVVGIGRDSQRIKDRPKTEE